MAITRQKKTEILRELAESVSDALSMVFVRFKGLSVKEANELRTALKAQNVRYRVTKKTLLKRALDAGNIIGNTPELEGEVAFAYLSKQKGDDITAPARNIHGFVKKSKGRLTFLGGIIEGRFLSKEEVETVAAIPPTPVLRGMFVNVINSPIQRMVIALDAIAQKKTS